MKRAVWVALVFLVVTISLATVALSKPRPVPLSMASVIVEINSTDGDAGLQPSLDGEPWKRVVVHWPDGRVLFDVSAQGELQTYGLTELFSESSEPPFTEFPLEQFKALFPEGEYRFVATGIDGVEMVGSDVLTHDFPAGPEILSPVEGAKVAPDDLVVEWAPVTEPGGIDITAYQVLVVRENPLRVFSVDLPEGATSVTVPGEFLERRVDYKVEVLAIEVSGNQTLTEVAFRTK